MKPLTDGEVAEILMREETPAQEAREVAPLAEGSMIKAFDLTGEGGEIREFSTIFIQMMRLAYARNVGTLRILSDQIAAMGREKTGRFLAYCARMTRESFIFNLRTPDLNAMTRTEAEFNVRFSPFINHNNVERLMVETERAHDDVLRNANARLVLFDFMLKVMMQLRKK